MIFIFSNLFVIYLLSKINDINVMIININIIYF